VLNTHFTVHCCIEGNTDLHKCDVKVHGDAIVIAMYDYSCSTMSSSSSIGESGARPHRERSVTVDSKISMFALSIQLIECYIVNSMRSSSMSIVCVSIYRV
jgi:hypothetical protein